MKTPLRRLETLEPGPRKEPAGRVADVLVEALKEAGVSSFFGIPGGAIAPVYDALVEQQDVTVVNTRHETGAVFMAMGQYRVSQKLACVLVTSGPGITNALTGLAAAHADGIPLIVLAGEVPRKNFGRGALQEGSRYQLDVLSMVRSVTKFSAEVSTPHSARSVLQKAVATALSGRQGPVFLSLPLDVANERVQPARVSAQVRSTFDVDDEVLAQAAEVLQRAERPLLLVGSGARSTEAAAQVARLAHLAHVPVVTTPKAKGVFPETDPLSLGIFGYGGHLSATEYLRQGVDVLLCVGCGLGETGTNSWSEALKPTKAFIQIDIDSAQVGRNYQVDYGLIGPAEVLVQKLADKIQPRPKRTLELGGVQRVEVPTGSTDEALHPAFVLTELQRRAPANTVFTADIGEHTIFALHYLSASGPTSFIVNTGYGSMGSGIGSAIGAKLGAPERPVVSVCGDYGFQMFGSELATCVEQKLGVVFAVFNDARMRMVENGLNQIFGRSLPMDGPRLNFAKLAEAHGAIGIEVKTVEDFEQLDARVFTGTKPVVLDLWIDPDAAFPVHGRIAQINNFTGKGKSL